MKDRAQIRTTLQEKAASRNTFWALGEDLVEWPIGAGDAISGRYECEFFRRALDELDRMAPSLGLRFVVTEEIGRRIPMRGEDVVVLCLGDELARMPGYAHDVRLVVKTYGTQRPWRTHVRSAGSPVLGFAHQTLVQLRRAPGFLAGRLHGVAPGSPRIIDVPLGTFLLRDVPYVPFDERRFDVWFAGSKHSGGNSRDGLLGLFPTQKTSARRRFLTEAIAWRGSRPDLSVYSGLIPSFHDAAGHADDYSTSLMQSRIALCPRGNSLETYRLNEAMSFGCVCIVEDLPSRDFYNGAPVVRVRHWGELPDAVASLSEDKARLRSLHEQTLGWWRDHLAPRAVARRILDALEGDETQGRRVIRL